MASKPIPQPNARTFSIVDVVAELGRGRMRIPEFQRPLRWKWEDVCRLFDSIVKGYPIGNLLLWQKHAPAAHVRLGALSIDAPEFPDGWWVVDGQQRLISLANALSDDAMGDDRFALAYDLEKAVFTRVPKTPEPFIVPLPVLFDLQRLLRWMVTNQVASEMLDDASRITKAIREFSIPAYVVEQQDETVLRDIFDRVNNSGKRLSRAEVFSALHPAIGGVGAGQWSLENIITTVDRECLFGQLDDDAVLSAILARRGPDFTRDIHSEFGGQSQKSKDFGEESQNDAYRNGQEAIVRAVQFLQRDAGVPHVSFLPYRYLLVVLSRFFAHFPSPEPRNRILLRRWFWRAAMLGLSAFRGGTTGATRELAGRIRAHEESESVARLLTAPMDRPLATPDLKRFNMKAAESRVVLCALWALRPCSLITGMEFGQEDLGAAISSGSGLASVLERIVRTEPKNQKAWVANRLFLLDEAPNGIADLITTPPPLLEGEKLRLVRESHALSDDLVSRLADGDFQTFLAGRQDRLERVVSDFVTRMTEAEFEDTPPLDELDLDADEENGDDHDEA